MRNTSNTRQYRESGFVLVVKAFDFEGQNAGGFPGALNGFSVTLDPSQNWAALDNLIDLNNRTNSDAVNVRLVAVDNGPVGFSGPARVIWDISSQNAQFSLGGGLIAQDRDFRISFANSGTVEWQTRDDINGAGSSATLQSGSYNLATGVFSGVPF